MCFKTKYPRCLSVCLFAWVTFRALRFICEFVDNIGMIKEFFRKNNHLVWILFVTLIVFSLALLFQRASQSSYNPRIEKKLFENKLHNKIALLHQSLGEIAREKNTGRYNSLFSNFTLLERFSAKSNDSFGYVLAEKGRAKAWSKQASSYFISDSSLVANEAQFLGDGWYYVASVTVGREVIWALFCIKHEYPYQNNYLVNYFSDDFGLSSITEISRKSNLKSFPIKDVQGKYMFSLTLKGKTKVSELLSTISTIFVYLFLICTLIFLAFLTKRIEKSSHRHFYFFVEIGCIFIFYFLFIQFQYPQSFFEQELFTASYFAASSLLPSLGSFMILSIIIFFATSTFSDYYADEYFKSHFLSSRSGKVKYGIAVLLSLIFYLVLFYLIRALVQNSSDLSVFFKVTDYHFITYIKVAALVLLVLSYHLFSTRLSEICADVITVKLKLLILVGLIAISLVFASLCGVSVHWSIVLFFFLSQISILIPFKSLKAISQYALFIWFVSIYAFFLSYTLLRLNVVKERQDRKLLLENIAITLTNENDPNAEFDLVRIGNAIDSDSKLVDIVQYSLALETELRNYVVKSYFSDGWEKYDIQVVGCFSYTNLELDNSKKANCYQYFFERAVNFGTLISNSKTFYSVNNKNGKITYLGIIKLNEGSSNEFSVFITLESKVFSEGLGYPELLKSNSEIQQSKLQEIYGYAKYVNNTLVKRVGATFYPIEGNVFQGAYGSLHELEDDGFIHLVLHSQPDTMIVLSRPKVDLKRVLLAFSLIFTSLFFAAALIFLIQKYKTSGKLLRFSIQQRIQIAFVALVLFLTFSVILGSVYLSIYRFKEKNSELLSQKVKSLMLELESYHSERNYLFELDKETVNSQLMWLSNVFHCDVNLYNTDGRLFATSRSILFDRHLIGKQMDSEAYVQLTINKRREFIQDEHISNLRYTSAYTALYNRNNRQIAFINIPYFTGDKELEEEVTSLLVAIVNSAMFFLVIIIAIAMVVANKITAPMTLIQDGLEQIKIGKQNRKIEYQAEDEVGKLIAVYNQMVDQLAESANLLAKTEREDAWREMAKQIAHEIKNPLTPMKLSVQHLLRAWNDKKENFDTYIQKVAATLVEQIDNLSAIASEFSHFAKMPEGVFEEINLAVKLSNIKLLFGKGEDVDIYLNIPDDIVVTTWADNDQLTTVFNNLIKNGIQATGGKRKSVINIDVLNSETEIIVKISDNGNGVPKEIQHRLFEPNFTTKSSGMGLGLAISKKIVESTKGSISFTTQEGIGSVFEVRFPQINKG